MKIVNHKAKIKFSVGQKVFYKYNKKAYQTTISKIYVETVFTKKNKNPETNVYYTGMAKSGYCYWYRANKNFTEDELYATKEEASRLSPEEKKVELTKRIKQLKKSISSNKQSIKKATKKLEEIRKEELVEELAGI